MTKVLNRRIEENGLYLAQYTDVSDPDNTSFQIYTYIIVGVVGRDNLEYFCFIDDFFDADANIINNRWKELQRLLFYNGYNKFHRKYLERKLKYLQEDIKEAKETMNKLDNILGD